MAVTVPDDLDASLLLDLTFLTPEERKKIMEVLDEDDKLLTEERIRLGYGFKIYYLSNVYWYMLL